MVKKNTMMVFGKKFHLTKSGKMLPYRKGSSEYRKCVAQKMHDNSPAGYAGKSQFVIRSAFQTAIVACHGRKKRDQIRGSHKFQGKKHIIDPALWTTPAAP